MEYYDRPPYSQGNNNYGGQYRGNNGYNPPPRTPPGPPDNSNLVKIMIIVAAAVVAIAIMVTAAFIIMSRQKENGDSGNASQTSATEAVQTTAAVVRMPDLKGLSKEDGIERLSQMNIKAEIIETETDKQKPGYVFSQVPASGEAVRPGETVTLYVAKAKATQPTTQKPTEQPTTQKVTSAPQTDYLYCCAATYVALREGTGVSYRELARIPSRGQMIKLGVSGDWYYVEYNGTKGYVYGEYVSSDPNAPIQYGGPDYESRVSSNTLRCTADDFVSLRTGPNKNYTEILRIPGGATMTFLSNSTNGWYFVQYGNQRGYVYSAYVEFI